MLVDSWGVAMSERVSVDPVNLRYGGQQLGGWHDEAIDVFHGGFRTLAEAAEAGWVGASARALAERVGGLQASARDLTARLGENSARFVAAAYKFELDDSISAANLAKPPSDGQADVAPPVSDRMLNL